MLVACWSAKGGSGTTVVAAAIAATLARSSAAGSVIADLDGDVPAVLGVPDPPGPGIAAWLAAGAEVPADALRRLEVEVAPAGMRLLPSGGALPSEPPGRGEVLAAMLAADPRPVVADCGSAPGGPALAVAAAAAHSLLVTRPCYLSLRRALALPLRPSGVVVVDEPGRALGVADVEAALGVPVRAIVPVTQSIARAVDAGLLAVRLPRALERAVRRAA